MVLKFSRARRRYERQGLLVEERALAQADADCLADGEVRERRKERERERRAELDEEYVRQFANRIRELYSNAHLREGTTDRGTRVFEIQRTCRAHCRSEEF